MVKVHKIYTCEICKDEYKSMKGAKDCEDKGVPKIHPIGMIFSTSSSGKDIVFAIIKQNEKSYGHHHSYSAWACRDTPAGDNVGGDSFCGFESWNVFLSPNKNTPAYNRMVKALKKDKIKPIDYKKEMFK